MQEPNIEPVYPPVGYNAKYIGGQRGSKSGWVTVFMRTDRVEIKGGSSSFSIPYTAVKDVKATYGGKEVSMKRVVIGGLVGGIEGAILGSLWKKDTVLTVIEYVDREDKLNGSQSIILDFGKETEWAQSELYRKVSAVRTRTSIPTSVADANPLDELKVRLAKGEITEEEYEGIEKLILEPSELGDQT